MAVAFKLSHERDWPYHSNYFDGVFWVRKNVGLIIYGIDSAKGHRLHGCKATRIWTIFPPNCALAVQQQICSSWQGPPGKSTPTLANKTCRTFEVDVMYLYGHGSTPRFLIFNK